MNFSGAAFGVGRAGKHATKSQPNLGSTIPILLASTMALTLSPLSASAQTVDEAAGRARTDSQAKNQVPAFIPKQINKHKSLKNLPNTTSLPAPSSYRVKPGDTVSGIAARFGLRTAEVLALNGLSWKSLIFPGQTLRLTSTPSTTQPTPPQSTNTGSSSSATVTYRVKRGDTVSGIARKYGVSTQSVLNANHLRWTSIIYPGQSLVIPGVVPPASTTPPSQPPSSQTSSSQTQPATPQNSLPQTESPTSGDDGALDATPVSSVTPITPTPPAPPQTTPPAESTYFIYRIKPGDTVTGIASRFGVSIQSVLTANGLNRSSIIYAGATLRIPGTSSAPASTGQNIYVLTSEMQGNAKIIIQVGRSLGVSDYGIVIALAAAAQESTLRNLTYGHLDSVGVFQQRPSAGWGSISQLTDPVYASKLFFGGPSNPNKGKTRGLLDIPNWQGLSVTQAAQAVQRSAYPNAYAKWEASARAWLAELG